MTGPDLPQPIYPGATPQPPSQPNPTPGMGPGSGSVPPQGQWTPPPGSFGPPSTPQSGPNRNLLIAGGAVVALVVVLGLVFALSGGDDDDPTNRGDDVAAADDSNEQNEPDDQGDGPVDEGRARRVAELQVIGASESTVSCIADELGGQPDLLDTLETMPNGVVLNDAGDADTYASLIMGCASVDELVSNVSAALSANGADSYSVGCFDSQASMMSSSDWEEMVKLIVQPSRSGEFEQQVSNLMVC